MQPNLSASADVLSAERQLAGLHIRADTVTSAIVARAIAALPPAPPLLDPDGIPRLSFDQAAELGGRMARQFALLAGDSIPPADDMAWADLVQFMLREARAMAAG
jgi:hypothetical protein